VVEQGAEVAGSGREHPQGHGGEDGDDGSGEEPEEQEEEAQRGHARGSVVAEENAEHRSVAESIPEGG